MAVKAEFRFLQVRPRGGKFLSTVPTTLQGLRAAIAYAVEIDRNYGLAPVHDGRIADALLSSPLFAA